MPIPFQVPVNKGFVSIHVAILYYILVDELVQGLTSSVYTYSCKYVTCASILDPRPRGFSY